MSEETHYSYYCIWYDTNGLITGVEFDNLMSAGRFQALHTTKSQPIIITKEA